MLYGFALLSPVVSSGGPRGSLFGHEVVGNILGLWSIPPQLANVGFVIGLLLLLAGNFKGALIVGGISSGLAALAPFCYGVSVADLRIGFPLWLGSCAVLAIAGLIGEASRPSATRAP
ncbi:MAG: hypothetical protein HONBIEJF_01512 [Fimbriimonadaceae bacterium]|nr:hypothetical protein [Fimbriimonadaceae bacterium]